MQRLLSIVLLIMLVAASAASAGKPAAVTGRESISAFASQAAAPKSVSEPAEDFLASLEPDQAGGEKVKEQPAYVTALSFIFKLLLVLGLCYATIFVLKRFSNMRGPLGVGQRHIKVIDNFSLGANKSVHLIAVGSRRLLVASTASQINVLAELTAEEIPDTEISTAPVGFKDQLAGFMGAGGADISGAERKIVDVLRDSSAFIQNKSAQLRNRRTDVKADSDE